MSMIMFKRPEGQNWTDILSCFIRVVLWLIPIGCIAYLVAGLPFYDAFTKEYKSERALIRAANRVDNELKYPESMADQWSDVLYLGILDGRFVYSEMYGYKLIGKTERENIVYKVTVCGEVAKELEAVEKEDVREYRGVKYNVHSRSYEENAIIREGDNKYTVYVSPCEVDRSLNPAVYNLEGVLTEVVEDFIDHILE